MTLPPVNSNVSGPLRALKFLNDRFEMTSWSPLFQFAVTVIMTLSPFAEYVGVRLTLPAALPLTTRVVTVLSQSIANVDGK